MGNFNRDDRSSGGYRGGFSRGGRDSGRGGFSRGRSSFGGGGFNRGGDRGDRPMYTAICSNCGKECQVPFRPTTGKPVYCSDCFEKMGNGRGEAPRQERSDFRPQAQVSNQNNTQLETLNAKLDKIISLLEPKVEKPIVSHSAKAKAESPELVEGEVKAPKVKKEVKKAASTKKK